MIVYWPSELLWERWYSKVKISSLLAVVHLAYSILIYSLVSPNIHCTHALGATAWLGGFAVPVNALLFLFRINGVYSDSRAVTSTFIAMWLTTFTSLTAPFGFQAVAVEPSSFCLINKTTKMGGAGVVPLIVFDTAVFFAITARILSFTVEEGWKARFNALRKGRGIGRVSWALLRTGMIYYGWVASQRVSLYVHSLT